ncbi:hypothetical protein AB0I60_27365 [Actinosynnema sp. NPDC050436]
MFRRACGMTPSEYRAQTVPRVSSRAVREGTR